MSYTEQQPDVTVVTVCYNAQPFLAGAIASVVAQRQSSLIIEHLVIDGHSTDGTQTYLQQALEQNLISSYISEPDQGIYDAMNKGIARANGKVIVFLNCDDEFLPGAISALATPILADMADYTMGTARVLENGTFTSHRCPDLENAGMGAICCHQTLFCKTEILKTLGGFDGITFPTIADGDFMAKLVFFGYRHHCVEGDHVIFREGGASSGCTVIAADQYVSLIEKYWPYLYKSIMEYPKLYDRVYWDIKNKINNLKNCTTIGREHHHLLSILCQLQCNLLQYAQLNKIIIQIQQFASLQERIVEAPRNLRRRYMRYRLLAKICWGKTKKHYEQKKHIIKQQLKQHTYKKINRNKC